MTPIEWFRYTIAPIVGIGTARAVIPLLKKVKPVFLQPPLWAASALLPSVGIAEGIIPGMAAAGGALASTPLAYLGTRIHKFLTAGRPTLLRRLLRRATAGTTLLASVIAGLYIKSLLTGKKKK